MRPNWPTGANPMGPGRDPSTVPLARVLEVGKGWHAYKAAAQRLAWPSGLERASADCPLLVAATLDPEGWKAVAAEALQVAEREGACRLVMDARPDDLDALVTFLSSKGRGSASEVRSFSELGDALAQNRAWVLAEPRRRALEPDWLTRGGRGGGAQAVGAPMGPHLWDARRIPLPDWLPAGTVHLDPRAGTVRQRTQAQVLGRVRLPTGEWATLYSSGGPAPASLWDRGARSLQVRYVYDPRGPGPGIRALRPEEYASVKGLPEPDREWDLPRLRELLRAPAPQAAARALSTAARGPTPVESAGKQGGARDPEEDLALAQLREWLRRANQGHVGGEDAEALAVLGLSAADPDSDGLTCLLQLFGLDPWAGCSAPRDLGVVGAALHAPAEGVGEYEAHLRHEAEALILDSLAESTGRSYCAAWEKWLQFCRLRGTQPFLEGLTQVERARDEDELLLFMVHEGSRCVTPQGRSCSGSSPFARPIWRLGTWTPWRAANGSGWRSRASSAVTAQDGASCPSRRPSVGPSPRRLSRTTLSCGRPSTWTSSTSCA